MPGRKYSAGTTSYRYGFGGQEKSDEIKGEGNSYTAEYWEYDSRLVRRWNVDPITKPWESPYASFRNNPVNYIDPLGLDSDVDKPKKSKYKTLENVTVVGIRKKGSKSDKKSISQPTFNFKEFATLNPPRVGLDGVNIQRPPSNGIAQDLGRFNLPITTSSKPSPTFNFRNALETGGFVTDHGEKALDLMGKGSIAKKVGTANTVLTSVSLVDNAVHKNWMGVIVDGSDIALSNIAKTSPYYYAGKTLAWTFTGDFAMSQAYWDWEDQKKVLINNFRYHRQQGNETEVEKIQKQLIFIERGQAQIRKQLLPSE